MPLHRPFVILAYRLIRIYNMSTISASDLSTEKWTKYLNILSVFFCSLNKAEECKIVMQTRTKKEQTNAQTQMPTMAVPRARQQPLLLSLSLLVLLSVVAAKSWFSASNATISGANNHNTELLWYEDLFNLPTSGMTYYIIIASVRIGAHCVEISASRSLTVHRFSRCSFALYFVSRYYGHC